MLRYWASPNTDLYAEVLSPSQLPLSGDAVVFTGQQLETGVGLVGDPGGGGGSVLGSGSL